MIIRIILVISFGIVLPILFFCLRSYGKPAEGRIFGVTLGELNAGEEEIVKIQKRYRKELNWFGILFLTILVAAVFVPYFSICYTILIFWMLFLVVLFEVPLMRANSMVKRCKEEKMRGSQMTWQHLAEEEGKKRIRRVSAWVFAIATIVILMAALVEAASGFKDRIIFIAAVISYLSVLLFIAGYLCYKPYHDMARKKQAGDEDDHWLGGIYYYNKEDTSFMVEKRIGIGTTVNMARKSAKVFAIILAVFLLILPVSCVWLVADEFGPIQLILEDGAVKCCQFEGTYKVAVKDVKSIEAITVLPDADKRSGTDLDNLYRGSYRIDGYDECTVCLDPSNLLFLVITQTNGKTYIFSDETDAGTKEVYDKLLLQLQKV